MGDCREGHYQRDGYSHGKVMQPTLRERHRTITNHPMVEHYEPGSLKSRRDDLMVATPEMKNYKVP